MLTAWAPVAPSYDNRIPAGNVAYYIRAGTSGYESCPNRVYVRLAAVDRYQLDRVYTGSSLVGDFLSKRG